MQSKELNDTSLENEDVKEKLENALQMVDKIIEKGVLDCKDIEILIERIEVDETWDILNPRKAYCLISDL